MNHKVFVVTGGRQGIGLCVVRQLVGWLAKERQCGTVYLVDRDDPSDAVAQLKSEGFDDVVGYQLDITDHGELVKFRDFLSDRHQGVDCIINNAAIAFKKASQVPFADQVSETLRVNFFGTLQVCEELLPLLRKSGRVVITSSNQVPSTFSNLSIDLKRRFVRPDLSIMDLKHLMQEFEHSAKQGTLLQHGWVEAAYATSKIALTFLASVYQRQFDLNSPGLSVAVNSYDPGRCQTYMSSFSGDRTASQGADTAVYLATLEWGPDAPMGKFLFERGVVPFPPTNEFL